MKELASTLWPTDAEFKPSVYYFFYHVTLSPGLFKSEISRVFCLDCLKKLSFIICLDLFKIAFLLVLIRLLVTPHCLQKRLQTPYKGFHSSPRCSCPIICFLMDLPLNGVKQLTVLGRLQDLHRPLVFLFLVLDIPLTSVSLQMVEVVLETGSGWRLDEFWEAWLKNPRLFRKVLHMDTAEINGGGGFNVLPHLRKS